MLNKILKLSFVIFFIICTISVCCYATDDVLMDLEENSTVTNQIVDDTTYTDNQNNITNSENSNIEENSTSDFEYAIPEVSVDTDYDNSDQGLSVSNMINIIFIVVGIVLILLGIAIIIKLK